MKTAVALLSLILVVSCTADQYQLKCTRNEMGIFWPNYDDTTKYYHCLSVGNPVVMGCNSGNVFTFVYQTCTPQTQYIPAPPLYNLPTDAPSGGPGTTATPSFTYPTPLTPSGSNNSTTSSSTKSTASTTTKTTTPAGDTTSPTSSTTKTTTTKTTPTTTGAPTPPTPPGGVPNPPSPPPSGIPMPSTPAVTPPVIDTAPPSALPTVPSSGN